MQNNPTARFRSPQLLYQSLLRGGLSRNCHRVFRIGSRVGDRFLLDLGFHLCGDSVQSCLLFQSRRFAGKLRAVQIGVLCQTASSFQNLPQRVALLDLVNTRYANLALHAHQHRLAFYGHGNIALGKNGDDISGPEFQIVGLIALQHCLAQGKRNERCRQINGIEALNRRIVPIDFRRIELHLGA